MVDIHFTRTEANQKVGQKVRSLSTFGSVPQGTQGTVVKVIRSDADHCNVRVRWKVPRLISLIDAAEFSFFKREKPTVSDFSKSEYAKSVQEIS
jgi:hypothetical protein